MTYETTTETTIPAKTTYTTYVKEEKVYKPEAYLLSPIHRKITNTSAFGVEPCGSTEKGKVHFVA